MTMRNVKHLFYKTRMQFSNFSLFCALLIVAFSAVANTPVEQNNEWDVNNPGFPIKRVSINTQEGTWMNLSVSPDGRKIAFDLLGDIYIMPINGGVATALTSSIAWDMQPRFSPDGQFIAFTSDQGGGDNIWLMDINGDNVRAVTTETFRLVNNPTWSPAGDFIAVRKHYTSARANGAGEIWVYHINGGEGIRLVERPTLEKDLGEPAFAPKARAIYFSQDITPGKRFEYSRDSNKQIYAIKKYDLEKGNTETVASGNGGAVRPTPSPDGKYLAYIRRVSNQTTLFVKDLTSGEDRAIYHDLDRDMQETWAIHGVYANMDWTPDSKELVFWAKGKIHRLNIKTLAHHNVPFTVNHYRDVAEALRYPVEVSPTEFTSKMLRWVSLSPTGDRIVFHSAGYLYVKHLKSGQINRLTRQRDHFEFYPAFSPDGKWITYATWNDLKLGSIRKVKAGGGKSFVLTQQRGHYIKPLFSTDMQSVYYQAVKAGNLRSPQWSMVSGIYRISAKPDKNKQAQRLVETGNLIQVVNNRIFIAQNRSVDPNAPEMQLVSVDPTGNALRQYVSSKWISEFSLSPDKKWLAFVERFQVYVVPFMALSRAVELGADTSKLPIKKLSSEGGQSIHWSADSRQLQWSMGNRLFQQRVKPLFGPVAKTQASSLAQPEQTSINLTHKTDTPEGTTALVGARIITMEGDQIIENATLIIENNRIQSLGPSSTIVVPKSATVIDVAGKTITPGFIDVHWHGTQGTDGLIPQQNWKNFAALAFGVTTIHDPFGDTPTIFSTAEMQRIGEVLAPRIFSTGSALYGAATSFMAVVDSLDDARSHVNRLKAVGAISVKSYIQPRRDQRQKILQAAREAKLMVVAEGEFNFQHDISMIIDGHTGIEHAVPVAAIYEDVKQLWRQSNTGNTPTLVVSAGGIAGENYWYQQSDVWKHPLLSKYVPRDVLEPRARRRTMAPVQDYNHIAAARVAKSLQDIGVSINLGAHGQREGLGAHWELWMFVQGGMTPHRALRAVTFDSAKYLGFDKDMGSLAPGKLADLIIFEKNPLENIRNSDEIHAVMLNGRLYDVNTMNEVGSYSRKRKPFYFEKKRELERF